MQLMGRVLSSEARQLATMLIKTTMVAAFRPSAGLAHDTLTFDRYSCEPPESEYYDLREREEWYRLTVP